MSGSRSGRHHGGVSSHRPTSTPGRPVLLCVCHCFASPNGQPPTTTHTHTVRFHSLRGEKWNLHLGVSRAAFHSEELCKKASGSSASLLRFIIVFGVTGALSSSCDVTELLFFSFSAWSSARPKQRHGRFVSCFLSTSREERNHGMFFLNSDLTEVCLRTERLGEGRRPLSVAVMMLMMLMMLARSDRN